jgi:ATP-dependent Lhr-like helicase
VLTASCAELLEATVTIASSHAAQYEPIRIPDFPLDVLCQQLLGMAAERPWTAAAALELVRRAAPFEKLPPGDFQACLDYLSGLGTDGQAWLPARLTWQDETFVIADERTTRILRRNIGTILNEEQRRVRLLNPIDEFEQGPPIGELDHVFAERLQAGDRFLLDGRCLECRRTEGRELLVEEVAGRPRVPHWHGDGWPLSGELARRLYLFRLRAAEALRDGLPALEFLLDREYGVTRPGGA